MQTHERITNQILEQLEKGVVPWQKPWQCAQAAPANLVSGRPYRGINVLLLWLRQYESPYWLTFRQAKQLGGHVNKREKGTAIVFWKWLDLPRQFEDDESESPDRIPLLRVYTVFNVAQCSLPDEKVPALPERSQADPIAACEQTVNRMPDPPKILDGGFRQASYNRKNDTVKMPRMSAFESSADYYATMFHELTHSTGHESRLNRQSLVEYSAFGDKEYSKEELVAEMGSAFLCAHTGLDGVTIANSAAYIKNWLEVLKADSRMVVTAAAQAQKAADYILNRSNQELGVVNIRERHCNTVGQAFGLTEVTVRCGQ